MGEEDLGGFFLFVFGGFLLLFVVVVGFFCLFVLHAMSIFQKQSIIQKHLLK